MSDEPPKPQVTARELFRTEWEFAAAPYRSDARMNYESAIKFANAGIKSLFTLNGGGLIALPAFIALFDVDRKKAAFWIIVTAVVYIVGLVGAALSSLLSYISAMAMSESMVLVQEALMWKYADLFEQTPPAKPPDIPAIEARSNALSRRSIYLRMTAVLLAFASLLAFIVGAAFSMYMLIKFRPLS